MYRYQYATCSLCLLFESCLKIKVVENYYLIFEPVIQLQFLSMNLQIILTTT